ncbi:MAG: fibronectin type III domain-containing protein [Fibrobacteria bacterium]|nr:fibronectin type III domain-containing protein [Fibrobacteria bacterium]
MKFKSLTIFFVLLLWTVGINQQTDQAYLDRLDNKPGDNLLAKTATTASIAASQADIEMKPYLQSPTPSSIYINWHSAADEESKVIFGTSQTALENTATGTVHKFTSSQWWHSTKLTGLTPNTEYYYQCISGTKQSEIHTFRTIVANTDVQTRVRFLLYGDTRSNYTNHKKVVNAIKEKVSELYGDDIHNQVSLLMNVGDIVGGGDELSDFIPEYFDPIVPLSASFPYMIAAGNHELETDIYYNYIKYEDYESEGGEKFYSFRVGSALFVSLNTNIRGDEQVAWLDNIMSAAEENDEIYWVFCFLHEPGHSEVWKAGNNQWVQDEIIPTLAEYSKAELLAYGHSHNFERGAWFKGNLRLMLSGGGGANLDRWNSSARDYPEIQRSHDHYTYSIFELDPASRSFTCRSYSLGHPNKWLDNVEIDRFHRFLDDSIPATPHSLAAPGKKDASVTLTASPFFSKTDIMSSQFQLTSDAGDYSNPLIDTHRDWENVYLSSGGPDYKPIDKNAGIDLTRLEIRNGVLDNGNSYSWRMRYRDQNMQWSLWSEEQTFTVSDPIDAAGFTADTTTGPGPFTVHFTDLSSGIPTGWQWDLDGDGITDSDERDPVWTYQQPGSYKVSLTVNYSNSQKNESKTGFITISAPASFSTTLNLPNKLTRIHPNPCRNQATIQYQLKSKSLIKLDVLDVHGKLITRLINKVLPSGPHHAVWNGTDKQGNKVKSGQYFIRMHSGDFKSIRKIIFLH